MLTGAHKCALDSILAWVATVRSWSGDDVKSVPEADIQVHPTTVACLPVAVVVHRLASESHFAICREHGVIQVICRIASNAADCGI